MGIFCGGRRCSVEFRLMGSRLVKRNDFKGIAQNPARLQGDVGEIEHGG
jgi:hypothetical protein